MSHTLTQNVCDTRACAHTCMRAGGSASVCVYEYVFVCACVCMRVCLGLCVCLSQCSHEHAVHAIIATQRCIRLNRGSEEEVLGPHSCRCFLSRILILSCRIFTEFATGYCPLLFVNAVPRRSSFEAFLGFRTQRVWRLLWKGARVARPLGLFFDSFLDFLGGARELISDALAGNFGPEWPR